MLERIGWTPEFQRFSIQMNPTYLQNALTAVSAIYETFGIKFNTEKTKALSGFLEVTRRALQPIFTVVTPL